MWIAPVNLEIQFVADRIGIAADHSASVPDFSFLLSPPH
jgi:hypothetical protein